MIEIKNVSKTFLSEGKILEAVKDVSLHIKPKEVFGIIGFSGAGKSTLVRCINLLERPSHGSIIVDGQDITSLSPKELHKARKNIGMIFQHFNLMKSRNVFQNIAYPLKGRGQNKNEIKEKVNALLKLVELEDKAKAYPSQLSGGQKQRVAIARALATDPKVLLCDEATSALDPQTTLSILKLLKQVNKQLGITIVIITHEMAVIKEVCNRVAVMENGKIAEEGEVFQVFSSPRQEVTKGFIDTTSVLHKIYDLIETSSPVVQLKPGEKILKLKYLEKKASEALISIISRDFNIDCNIIFGSIEIIGDAPLGGLVIIVSGKSGDIEDAINYLESKNVEVEVLDID
ncbi:MAG: methionine transporter ATP-binding protein [Clostridiales bacterium]|jgi:D-methionine transport system ATP-binding protein|nr:methionine transporter ATP-binding protein [Clostridiales bacterium]